MISELWSLLLFHSSLPVIEDVMQVKSPPTPPPPRVHLDLPSFIPLVSRLPQSFFFRVREFAPTEEEKWVEEFQTQMGSDLASVAKEMTKSITDPSINATEVLLYILQVWSFFLNDFLFGNQIHTVEHKMLAQLKLNEKY